ncbi:MAG: M42 family metallopeptidase [Kiritimatiellia bacterium]|jgi:endoglucanase|nr:M42 family metallopeptidase [Kiritimatiellia bacterium]MDP6810307.1 M42 family metallopeptidase [Kiritimatiellia bacterium]MDP7022704.1 M42 family metallopeptidase [Kiritimatiellia bacterium]
MNKTALTFFQDLMATPSPTGWEHRGQNIVAAYMKCYADTVETDVHGSVHGVMNPGATVRVMLAGHCDEIGLMVQYISDKGLLTMSALGGVNVPLLQGERIIIHTAKGPVPGVVGVMPIHMIEPKDREKAATKIHDLWVDIGAKSRKDAEKAVKLGDVATIDAGWTDLKNGLVACRGFDDRVGAFVVADVLRQLKNKPLKVAVHAVSTVQEEVGLRGGRTAAFAIDPHIGIAVDVGFATDYPGMNEKIVGTANLGDGPILHMGPTYSHRLLEIIRKTATKAKIRTQIQPEGRGTGTDAYAIQMTRGGVAAGLVSVPSRYMHSPVETIALKDAEATAKLIAETIIGLSGREKFTR